MGVFVSLFRAINVGGHSQVKMAELTELHRTIGLANVRTYLQTGNVVFETDRNDSTLLASEIAQGFEQKFGFATEVMVRNVSELRQLTTLNPFNQPERESKWVVVMFLSVSPEARAKKELLEVYKGPEEMHFVDKELFIYYPEGIGRSKLSNNYIEKKIKAMGTGRNWNTVMKLLEMTQG
jgi:uncharacterized protein (DUF1697 family)